MTKLTLPEGTRKYRRVETIEKVVTEDHVLVMKDKVVRTGHPLHNEATYTVEWFNEDEYSLPESSAIYVFLETEFMKLTKVEDDPYTGEVR